MAKNSGGESTARVPEMALIALCGHVDRRSSTEFVIRKVKGRGARLLPRWGQPHEKTLLRRGGLQ